MKQHSGAPQHLQHQYFGGTLARVDWCALSLSLTRDANKVRMIASPCPVVEHPPTAESAYPPLPMSGESPTRPGLYEQHNT